MLAFFAGSTRVGPQVWRLRFELSADDGVTTLTFTQPGITPGAAPDVGPGWEYYLDRLATAMNGRPMPNFDDYWPSLAPAYADPKRRPEGA